MVYLTNTVYGWFWLDVWVAGVDGIDVRASVCACGLSPPALPACLHGRVCLIYLSVCVGVCVCVFRYERRPSPSRLSLMDEWIMDGWADGWTDEWVRCGGVEAFVREGVLGRGKLAEEGDRHLLAFYNQPR